MKTKVKHCYQIVYFALLKTFLLSSHTFFDRELISAVLVVVLRKLFFRIFMYSFRRNNSFLKVENVEIFI